LGDLSKEDGKMVPKGQIQLDQQAPSVGDITLSCGGARMLRIMRGGRVEEKLEPLFALVMVEKRGWWDW